jgi:zinc protease
MTRARCLLEYSFTLVLSTALLLTASLPQPARAGSEESSDVEIPYTRFVLDNGLTLIVHEDHKAPIVAVDIWYHVGSKNERRGRTGLAHLFEHMLFQGSLHVGTNDHFQRVQQVGGVANGSTWFDRTNYYETLPSQHLELGLWLESDRMGFLLPALTSEKLENQRDVVMNERRERIDNQPYGLAFERLHETLYPEAHPYHWPVIGYMDDIAAATLDDVRAFFSTYYRSNNAVLTLAGDIDPDSAIEKVDHWFGSLPAGDPPPPIETDFQASTSGERLVLEDRVELSRVYMAWKMPVQGS